MPITMELLITETNCITAIGHDSETTADSVFSGTAMISYDELRDDENGRPIKTAVIEGFDSSHDDEPEFMAAVAAECLSDLCKRYFEEDEKVEHLFLFLGYPSVHRPGPRFEGDEEAWMAHLEKRLAPYADNVYYEYFKTGNASAFHGLKKAREILSKQSDGICIVGGVDSLLSAETLSWFEQDVRLVSESPGRQHGLFPSHAAGFFIIESPDGAAKRNKKPLARIVSHNVTIEPAPFLSEHPCNGDGLTIAIRKALEERKVAPESISSIFCDLNGEYHKFREWGFADLRCFPDSDHSPSLFHPSDCMGDVGAAWLAVLTGIATEGFKRDVVGDQVMIFCSDDHGERGAMVLRKG